MLILMVVSIKAPAANETRDVTLTADDHEAVFTGPTAAEGTVTRRVDLTVNFGTRAKADIPTSSGWAHENNSSDRSIDIEDCGGSSGPDNVTIGYHGSPSGDSGYNFVTTIEGDITYCSGAAGVGPGEPATNDFTLLITDADAIHIDPNPSIVEVSTDEETYWVELQGVQWRNGDPDNSTESVTVDWSNVADVEFSDSEGGEVMQPSEVNDYQGETIWAKSSVAGQYTVNATMPGDEDNAAEGTLNILSIELKEGTHVVNNGTYVYINSTPQMPQLTSSLKPAGLSGDVKWRLHIEYKRTPRNDDEYYPGPWDTSWKTLSAGATWNIASEFGNQFRGGKATLYCEYQGGEIKRVFHIRGNNPTEAAVEAEIGANPWYAKPIARVESDYHQFNVVGTLGPNPADFKHCPNFGDPDGWGIMQLDPPPSDETLWNWKQNIADGKAHLADPCRTRAAAWIAEQEAQQQDEEPTKPLQNYIFTFNGVNYQKGTARTPTDACTIQRYNGAEYWVIYWKNKTPTQPGSWEINNSFREYVDAVSGEVQ